VAADASAADASEDVFSPSGPPSCRTLPTGCGANSNLDCCDSPAVPGGTYNRLNNPSYPATVRPFRLDRFEVTVGRFRRYVDSLATGNAGRLRANLACDPAATWTNIPGPNEYLPISCVLRQEAIDFCAWDDGWLPTEAEWNFTAAGGAEQRYFAWTAPGSTPQFDPSYVVCGLGAGPLLPVGTKPKGAAKWGQLDMAGNAYEIVADFDGPLPIPCDDCVNDAGPPGRLVHRGSSGSASSLDAGYYFSNMFRDSDPDARSWWQGFRCAR
jgi:formylglycine-generating enzyme required for sulfatase activity